MPLALMKSTPDDKPRIEFWAITGYAFGIRIADNFQYFFLLNISIDSQCNQFPDPKGVKNTSPIFHNQSQIQFGVKMREFGQSTNGAICNAFLDLLQVMPLR